MRRRGGRVEARETGVDKIASMQMYMVRSVSTGGSSKEIRFEKFLARGVVAIGWPALGDLSRFTSREEICEEIIEERLRRHLTISRQSAGAQAGNLFRFSRELLVGDLVITYDPAPTRRLYAVGKIAGEYTYDPKFFDFQEDNFPNLIPVDWNPVRFRRSQLSGSAKSALGPQPTVFQVRNEAAVEEILDLVRDG